MNIIVKPYGSERCYCRPDTTLERENRDFYSPDCVDELYWAPVVFARISKAGKCIGSKFVSRYYDAFNFGILLYTGNGDLAFASCTDHTSILPSPLYNPIVIENEENRYDVTLDDRNIFNCRCDKGIIEEAICRASVPTSLRIGDYVAAELAPTALLAVRGESTAVIKGVFCENTVFEFKIIF